MQTLIHIARYDDNNLIIVKDEDLKNGCVPISSYEYDASGIPFLTKEYVPATIEKSFIVIASGKFIRNEKEKSALNSYQSIGELGHTTLMYHFSAAIVSAPESDSLCESDCVYSESGIKETEFEMRSYHLHGSVDYDESKLDQEVFESLNIKRILFRYLNSIPSNIGIDLF